MHRKREVLFACLIAMVVALAGALPAAAQPAQYEVAVVIGTTGPVAFLGRDTEQTLHIIEHVVNQHGGINGRPLHFSISDDQSSPAVAVQLVTGLIQKGVPVIVGPGLSSSCGAVIPLVKEGPVLLCLSPAVHPQRGSYVFAVSVTSFDYFVPLIRYASGRGWRRIASITSTDATGQDADRALARTLALPENAGEHLIDTEHFNPTDLSVAGQMARIKAANPDVLVAWTAGATPFGTLLHGLRDAGITVPILVNTANISKAQMTPYGDLSPETVLYPAPRAEDPNDGGSHGPIHDAHAALYGGFREIGIEPTAVAVFIWDNVMALVSTLQHLGPTPTASQIRTSLENLHDWVGAEGIYDFRNPADPEQRGVGPASIKIFRWDPKQGIGVAVSGPGGTR